MRTFTVKPGCGLIPLGRQGENYALQVRFPAAGWLKSHGEDGEFKLCCYPPGYQGAYTLTPELEDEYVCWNVSAKDTAFPGIGRAELIYYVGETVAISAAFVTKVEESLSGETPKYVDVSVEGQ